MTENPENLVGYCGLYCGACGIYQGKIRDAVDSLRSIIGAYGFDKIAPELAQWEPSFKNWKEYEAVLEGLVKLFGSCPACIQGGGDPNCKVRSCAKEKGYTTCAECSMISTCEKLAPLCKGYSGLMPALQKIKREGKTKYAQEMQQKVAKGFSYLDER